MENQLRNFWANLPHSWSAAPVQYLRDQWAGRRLIIVSAGPSLTEALPALRAARGTALLLATGTAARILVEHRILPDLVVSMDPFEANRAHFQGWDTSDVPLIYHHQIHRDIPATYTGPRFFFLMQDDPPLPMRTSLEKIWLPARGVGSFFSPSARPFPGSQSHHLRRTGFRFSRRPHPCQWLRSRLSFQPRVFAP